MLRSKLFFTKLLSTSLVLIFAVSTSANELTINGDLETGDTSGFTYFPSGNSTFDVVSTPASDVFGGSFSGSLENLAEASAAIVKQANLGVGVVQPNQEFTISFYAKGSGEAGGVQFAEFFSEIDGGGTSSSEILGGAPLFLGPDYEFYEFTTTAGADVSGGVTLQFNAATGANIGSTSAFFFDDVSVFAVGDVLNPLRGDFDGDNDVDLADLDRYIGNLDQAATGDLAELDLNEDGTVDADDFTEHYSQLVETSNGGKGTFQGDANLDGIVDVFGDGFTFLANVGSAADSWSDGDFNGDGRVDIFGDGFALLGNIGNDNGGGGTAAPATASVPEPGSLTAMLMLSVVAAARRRR